MELYRGSNTNQMDYNDDGRGPKSGKILASNDDRLDSGLDSLKEDEYPDVVSDFGRMKVDERQDEPWRKELTEDGDTAHAQAPCSHNGLYVNRNAASVRTVLWHCVGVGGASAGLWPGVNEGGAGRTRKVPGSVPDSQTRMFLHLAIIHEAKDAALKMIDLSYGDSFLNIQNNQRQTALHLAIITEQPHIVEQLLKAGCDASLVDDCGNTALHIACRKGSMACFGLLTQGCPQHLPAILQTPNYNGQKCIHVVAIHGYLSLLESLIQLGADINAQEQCNGRTALHLAVDLQNFELVKLLISKGADVHSFTYGGHTPYHLTYGRANTDIQKVLYELTAPHLRELPDSESEDSDEDYEDQCISDDEDMYDDIKMMGQ
ncbi:NF-kappa-B inhibitor alpha [Anabarilius grahami]|uniref:NF-kappa-B inhibitor alpha n=1 Tax=Anabarilius grahami TaxID=495550 RepID=A0A3N0XXI0_ANAGA|nr:NF-kappa-B inhibitor alpha [Anabarilius grahami]